MKNINPKVSMDKVCIKFLADVLYVKGFICIEELEDIMDCVNGDDLDEIIERMFRGDYNVYNRDIPDFLKRGGTEFR